MTSLNSPAALTLRWHRTRSYTEGAAFSTVAPRGHPARRTPDGAPAAPVPAPIDFGPPELRRNASGAASSSSAPSGGFKRYMNLARNEAHLVLASFLGVAVYSTSTLAIPHGFGELIDHASKGQMPWSTSWRLLSWFAVAGIGNFSRLALVGYAGERVIARLRERLYRSIIGQETKFFDEPENRTGALGQRLAMDTNIVGSSLTDAISNGVKNIFQTLGSLGVMLYFSPKLTGVICLVVPPVAIASGAYGRRVRRLQAEMQDALAAAGVVAEERLGNVRTVRAFGREDDEYSWYLKKVLRVLDLSKRMVLVNASYVAFLHVSGYTTLYCILWAGSRLVSQNALSAGTLFSFMLYTVYCGIGMMGITNLFGEVNKGLGASQRMFAIMDRFDRSNAEKAQEKGTIIEKFKGAFKFDNVTFAYPTRPETNVYDGLSLTIAPGKCTVVVGASGTGKSTMGALLLKLYDVDAGTITVDDTPIEEVDTQWLRNTIGYVPQEPVLFGGSIAQNIAYGLDRRRRWDEPIDQWTMAAVVAAAKKANAHDFITALPAQYNTFVGEGGRSLSGGQKQRIAIARALVKAPQLLVLDEATSALDAESEIVVQEAIERLVQDARTQSQRAVLMFAHKLSMIRTADTIVLLDKGRVVAEGSFEELKRNELFCQLVGITA